MKIINGKQLAANLNSDLSNKIAQLKFKYGKTPYLVVIIVGDNPASHVYVRNKEKKALEVGINVLKRHDGSSFIVGDVDYEEVSKNVAAISPVPGGVGPMTIHCLLLNTFSLAKKRNNLS